MDLRIFTFQLRAEPEKTVKVSHWCQWCETEFEARVGRAELLKMGAGEHCLICPNCKQET